MNGDARAFFEQPAWQEIVDSLKTSLSPALLSMVLFGSTARGTRREDSDVDILVVYDDSLCARPAFMRRFVSMKRSLCSGSVEDVSEEARMMAPLLSSLIMSRSEASEVPYVLLDIADEGIILFDREAFFETVRERIMGRLRDFGAKRISLPDGSWYWNLKPEARFGEVITI